MTTDDFVEETDILPQIVHFKCLTVQLRQQWTCCSGIITARLLIISTLCSSLCNGGAHNTKA